MRILVQLIIVLSLFVFSDSVAANERWIEPLDSHSSVDVPLSFHQNHAMTLYSPEVIRSIGSYETTYESTVDHTYIYKLEDSLAEIRIVQRVLPTGDYFIYTTFENPSSESATFTLVTKEESVKSASLNPYSKYPIRKTIDRTFGYDLSTYPIGLMTLVGESGDTRHTMYGKSYRSREYTKTYSSEVSSTTRELIEEKDALIHKLDGTTWQTSIPFLSFGRDTIDTWSLHSASSMFSSGEAVEEWMKESATYYRKRNAWYTAEGPYNRMAVSVEPLPPTYAAYGRNLLLVKEDRALNRYLETNERYYENLIHNAFVNLTLFKEEKEYWETEVTSTYLKHLYAITAPFIDTRFNEQIALFYYTAGTVLDVSNSTDALRDYADLLLNQVEKGNVVRLDDESYYISDYFPVVQDVKTHSSMNHVLGGMNILLQAYLEFGDESYLEGARAVQTAIEKQQDEWLVEDGDIWYKIDQDLTFVGRDYKHLTVEDLIRAYELWSQIDRSHLPVIERFIASKTAYLSANNFGYTTKLRNGLGRIHMLHYLPNGPEFTDAS